MNWQGETATNGLDVADKDVFLDKCHCTVFCKVDFIQVIPFDLNQVEDDTAAKRAANANANKQEVKKKVAAKAKWVIIVYKVRQLKFSNFQ